MHVESSISFILLVLLLLCCDVRDVFCQLEFGESFFFL